MYCLRGNVEAELRSAAAGSELQRVSINRKDSALNNYSHLHNENGSKGSPRALKKFLKNLP